MQDQWIRAADAIQVLQPRLSRYEAALAICRRAHAGLVRARAARMIQPGGVKDDYEIPAGFWWAEGKKGLIQSWETGDFETWIDHKAQLKAFDVSFALVDIHDILGLSPDENGKVHHWLTAKDALERVSDATGKNAMAAARLIVEYSKIGHLVATAQNIKIRYRNALGEQAEDEEATEEVPEWFWVECTDEGACVLDWDNGIFSGRGIVYENMSNVKLVGVKFRASEFSVFESKFDSLSEADSPEEQKGSKGGRRLSKTWPDWIAELALYIHEEGCPAGEGTQGQESMIDAIADRLAKRGIEGPSRTTVQASVRAVLERLRSAGN